MKINKTPGWFKHVSLPTFIENCCALAIIAGLLGCSSVQSLRVDPNKDPNAPSGEWEYTPKHAVWKPNTNYADRAGLAYFLPIGNVHILAIRNDNLVTNYGIIKVQYGVNDAGQALFVTNLVSAIQLITNTVTQVTSISNYATNIFPPTLTYSNGMALSSVNTGPVATNGTLKFAATTGTNTYNFTIASNALISTAASSSQTTTFSNQPAQLYATNSVYSVSNVTTIISEQPLVTTNPTYIVTVSANYQADRSKLFLLRPQMDWFHDDSGNITVDNNGLLSSINASNSDQTGNIIVSLAQAAVQSFEMAGGMPIGMPTGGGTPAAGPHPEDYSVKPDDVRNPVSLAEMLIDRRRNQAITNYLTQEDYTKLERIVRKIKRAETYGGQLQVKATQQHELTAITNLLNNILKNPGLNVDAVDNSGVKVRPATELIDSLVQPSSDKNKPRLKGLLNRMLLEDILDFAHPNTLRPVDWLGALNSIFTPQSWTPSFPQTINISFDPFNCGQLWSAVRTLKNANLTIENVDEFTDSKAFDTYVRWTKTPREESGGIFYRPPIPYEVRIRDAASNVVSATVLLPNKSPILHLELNKASFVATISQVTLTNGFISSYSFSKPSSALALASIPLVLLSDVTSSITNLLQLRINLATGQNALQSANYTSQSQPYNAALAQQTAQMMALSNSIAIYNLTQALKALTNSTGGQNQTH